MNSIPIHPTPSAYNSYYTPIAYSSQAPGLGSLTSNFATCNPFNTLHFHSNANKTVIDKQYTCVLFSRVFANQNPALFTLSLEGLPFSPLRPAVFFPNLQPSNAPFASRTGLRDLPTFQRPVSRPLPLRAPKSPRMIGLQKSIKTKDISILWNDRLTKSGGEGGTSFKPRNMRHVRLLLFSTSCPSVSLGISHPLWSPIEDAMKLTFHRWALLRCIATSLFLCFFPLLAAAQQDDQPTIRFVRNPDPAPDL